MLFEQSWEIGQADDGDIIVSIKAHFCELTRDQLHNAVVRNHQSIWFTLVFRVKKFCEEKKLDF